jgi:alkylation response protein AidB-like acyl-CoA dehydrogenase
MNFQPTSEQQQLADSVRRLCDKQAHFEARKAVVAGAAGHDPQVWAQLAELGVLGLPLPEAAGGFGGGMLDMMGVMAEAGRALLVEPLVPTLAGARLAAASGHAAGVQLAEQAAAGAAIVALAWLEAGARHDLLRVGTRAAGGTGAPRLTGRKIVVLHAQQAQALIVTARDDAGVLGLYLVERQAPGLLLKSYRTVDNLRGSDVDFDQTPAVCLAAGDAAEALLDEAADCARVLHCAEAIGALQEACDATLDYLKTRKQFGVPIGSFQALQHRMVDMTISTAQARSMALLAASTFDAAARGQAGVAERRRIVSAAKIKVGDACRHVGQEAIQLHGGMGMTQELKISHVFKRLTMLAQTAGDVDTHLARFAAHDMPAAAALAA